ncbi:hypothetical protein FK220_010260 [Flavobacteriaceae bacterium TP-CH-4]|uniref:Uncharacterized protein n=1 Tax=Pelagihabitans pacificus TaxID=2696054 RepID=A0A967B071_9FLAO|nr:hypothetical protein [Pelagihabitans pacificus]NHF59726.1 hypothetical protein [Pelagihabitans pacificus]
MATMVFADKQKGRIDDMGLSKVLDVEKGVILILQMPSLLKNQLKLAAPG